MKVIIFKNYQQPSEFAANSIAEAIKNKPALVL
jgi:hypothetical protein